MTNFLLYSGSRRPSSRQNVRYGRVLASFRKSGMLRCLALVLVLLICLVEVHELIPFLHTPSSELIPGDYCPLCIIKVLLTQAIAFLTIQVVYTTIMKGMPVFVSCFHPFLFIAALPARSPPF